MTRLRELSIVLAGCLLIGGSAGALAQDWGRGGDRGWDRGERSDRDRDRDDRDRDRDRRGWDRDRDDRGGRGRGWSGRFDDDRCHVVVRRYVDRDGDMVTRRSRVCD
jgi:hypothetical protein